MQLQIARVCEHKELSRVHSAISSDKPTQPSHGLVTPAPRKLCYQACASDVNGEGKTSISSLNKMTLPDWFDNDSNRCTKISKVAETIVLSSRQLHLKRKRCDELNNENSVLRSKLFCQNMHEICLNLVENPAR